MKMMVHVHCKKCIVRKYRQKLKASTLNTRRQLFSLLSFSIII